MKYVNVRRRTHTRTRTHTHTHRAGSPFPLELCLGSQPPPKLPCLSGRKRAALLYHTPKQAFRKNKDWNQRLYKCLARIQGQIKRTAASCAGQEWGGSFFLFLLLLSSFVILKNIKNKTQLRVAVLSLSFLSVSTFSQFTLFSSKCPTPHPTPPPTPPHPSP